MRHLQQTIVFFNGAFFSILLVSCSHSSPAHRVAQFRDALARGDTQRAESMIWKDDSSDKNSCGERRTIPLRHTETIKAKEKGLLTTQRVEVRKSNVVEVSADAEEGIMQDALQLLDTSTPIRAAKAFQHAARKKDWSFVRELLARAQTARFKDDGVWKAFIRELENSDVYPRLIKAETFFSKPTGWNAFVYTDTGTEFFLRWENGTWRFSSITLLSSQPTN